MGNCWLKPVDDLPNSNTIHSTPAHNNKYDTKAAKNRSHHPSPPPASRATHVPPSGQIIRPNLKMFSFSELESATRNFRPGSMLGEGGFGTVFKGWIDEKTYAPSKVAVGIPVAVKKSNPDGEQGLKEWQAEVKFLGKFSHPNLVKLLGYCWEEKMFLLVYEYMQKGNLESHLFIKTVAEPIPWNIRIKIAIGAARGLVFLHNTEKQVIYRDFKASNILLDEEFNAKLSDFGLAKLGPVDGNSHVTTQVLGTYGYAAPEYMATGHLYVKSDVYGFGVVLLEIITGLQVLDPNRPGGQINLVDWARPFLPDKKKLRRLIDPRLMGRYPLKGAYKTAELILSCLEPDHKCRPDMGLVLETLELISTIQMRPKELKVKSKQDRQHTNHDNQYDHRSPHQTYHGSGGARGHYKHNNLSEAQNY